MKIIDLNTQQSSFTKNRLAKRESAKSSHWRKITLSVLISIFVVLPAMLFMAQKQNADVADLATAQASAVSSCTAANLDAFLVIDKSESMEQSINGKKKLAWAKEAATTFVNLMAQEETNYVGIASFARHGGVGLPLTKANPSTSIVNVISGLKNESNNNGTCLECAMLDVNKSIASRGGTNKKFIIILSDGNINYYQKDGNNINDDADFPKGKAQAKAAIIASMNAGTYVYLVGIGVQNGDGQRYLKGIADEHPTMSKYIYGGSADAQLTEIYKEIATSMGKVSVSGKVFEDVNRDGKFTLPPDASLSGILVSLKLASAASDAAALASVKSDTNGMYTFKNLCAEKYRITQEIQPKYTQTLPEDPPGYYEIDVNKETKDITDKDFGSAKEQEITFNFNFVLHGLGIAGDNVLLRPAPCQNRTQSASNSATNICLSNQNPRHPKRDIFIELLDATGSAIATMSSTMDYDSQAGFFKGIGKMVSGISQGTYTFRAKTPMFLKKKIAFTQPVKPGETYTLPATDLIASDVDNDNQLSVLDYNLIVDCYTYPTQAKPTCDQAKSDTVDTDDNGIVNEFDLNLFVRELSERIGE